MIRHLTADVLCPARARLGEGPGWDAGAGHLVWVDILAGVVHLTAADGTSRGRFDVGTHVGAALPAADGSWLLATREGFATLGRDGTMRPLAPLLRDQPDT